MRKGIRVVSRPRLAFAGGIPYTPSQWYAVFLDTIGLDTKARKIGLPPIE